MADPRRDANVDLLRAAAIVMVLVYHWAQRWPVPARVQVVTELGQYGVDLFFVLSGWLIGGLFWKERALTGGVGIARFLARRWLRTIPPYLIALPIAWGAVAFTRQEPFDLGYLVFAQNYYERMPFFLVSWSLCVEEHFYLCLPFLLTLCVRLNPGLARWLPLLAVLPPAVRLLGAVEPGSPWGRMYTATHLRFEGLVLGVWAAWVARFDAVLWARLRKGGRLVSLPGAAALLGLCLLTPAWRYRVGFTVVAVVFLSWLVAVAGAKPIFPARNVWVQRVAGWSYSIYLTHAFVLYAVVEVLRNRMGASAPVAAVLLAATTLMCGAVFHRAVEQPAMRARERLAPARVARGVAQSTVP